jgi:uncharacterized protein YidB (DUF937 family)
MTQAFHRRADDHEAKVAPGFEAEEQQRSHEETDMGLLDILSGMQNGPRGQRQPGNTTGHSSSGGGLSPIMMALLGLLAYKALKGRGGQVAAPAGRGGPAALPPGGVANADHPAGGTLGDLLGGLFGGKPGGAPNAAGGKPGGSLSDLIPGGLGGLLGGAAAGTVLSGGLGNILKELQDSGHGRAAQSWVGTGPNQDIAPHDLANALGNDTLTALSEQTGMTQQDLLTGLSQHLPDLIDQLTPNGRLPTNEEASRMM